LGGLEAIGVQASYDPTSRLAQVSSGGKVMVLLPGARTALLDGRTVALSDTPAVRDGKLYVPVTDVAERLLGSTAHAVIERISRTTAE
jgi:hypothetical protein